MTATNNNALSNRRSGGFSLVELAVALSIIAFLIGGIMTGKALIRNADIRGIMTEFGEYNHAVEQFKSRFHALPGDMPNATELWGELDASPATCQDIPADDTTRTCDGDGDYNIEYNVTAPTHEVFRFWHHLQIAGLIDTELTGIPASTSIFGSVIGTNVPKGPLEKSGVSVTPSGTVNSSDNDYFVGEYPIKLVYGGSLGQYTYMKGPLLTPNEAWSIDNKMDDGRPGFGMVMGPKQSSDAAGDCTTTDVKSTSVWNRLRESVACPVIFLTRWQE